MTTSPFSIYVPLGMLYEQYKAEYFAAYIDSGAGICTAKQGVFPTELEEELPKIAGRDFSKRILILCKGTKMAEIIIGGAGQTPWYKVKTPPIYFHDTGADVLLGNNFLQMFKSYTQENETRRLVFTTPCDHKVIVHRLRQAFYRKIPIQFRSKRGDEGKLRHPKMKDSRRFGDTMLQLRAGQYLQLEEVEILKVSLVVRAPKGA